MMDFGCTECGACEEVCSMTLASGGKNSPAEKLRSAAKVMAGNYKPSDIKNIFQCTKCRACEVVCPEGIGVTEIIDGARGKYVSKKGVKFGAQRELIRNVKAFGTPFGRSGSRVVLPKVPRTPLPRTLLFTGCFSAYVNKDIALASFNILRKLGIAFTCLEDEPCCGYFIYNTGDHASAAELIEKNIRRFKEMGIERIISVCPGCTTFLTRNYHMDIEVVHISKLVSDLIEAGPVPIKPSEGAVTFHDACNIGRSLGLYEEPRNIIHAMGYSLVEMALSRERAMCCGADGGMKIIFPGLAVEIGKKRLEKGMPEGCHKLFTICPFCLTNLKEASRTYGRDIEMSNLLVEFDRSLSSGTHSSAIGRRA